ncbi:MAG: hypothetical protein COV35_08755 [Alphaproteobacteria bacterium CG11_big_fil_rev_8_21_14_0_20_39_49]|nr:MAG: hypothetical protein COV35_08755 [Alphaproteobacteria bacterium CG11_big_fil_rev_8_21_14_0_20_39_49]
MEYIDELLVAIDEQVSYILVGSIFTFVALFIFRKIISMFLFVVFGLILFAVVKLTVLQPSTTGDTTEGIIQKRMNSVQETIDESIEGVKKIKESMQEKVDGAKETRGKIDKTFDKFKEKEKSEFDKFMQELEKE